MASQEDIRQQEQLLASYRRTLAHLLNQAAAYGGEVLAPPQTANGIAAARMGIATCKSALGLWGVAVDDLPGDEAAPAQQGGQGSSRAALDEQRRGQLLKRVATVQAQIDQLQSEWEVEDGKAKMRLAQQIAGQQAILDRYEQELEQIEARLSPGR